MLEVAYAFVVEAQTESPALYGAIVIIVMVVEGTALALLAELVFRVIGIEVEKGA